ncbi:HdeD family acid-resistance protein [Enterococcus sp. DIV0876]|uniref:HdeD family acid-resistance protein n=1 Tax=Enterococcus sp. DIV0876 TaxID=2774633 RepID=UPI003D2FDC9A
MNAFFDKIQRYDLARAIVYIVFGLIILIAPRTVFNTIVYLVAGYIACLGIISLYTNYKDQKKGYRNVQFVSGILLLIAAAAILVFARGLLSIVPFFLGILITISGCTRLMATFNQKRSGSPYLIGLIISFAIIAAGIILVFNPFATWLLFFQIFGGILLFIGFSDAFSYFQRKKA